MEREQREAIAEKSESLVVVRSDIVTLLIKSYASVYKTELIIWNVKIICIYICISSLNP